MLLSSLYILEPYFSLYCLYVLMWLTMCSFGCAYITQHIYMPYIQPIYTLPQKQSYSVDGFIHSYTTN